MIGNGTSWALMISLDLEVISEYKYRFKKMRIKEMLAEERICLERHKQELAVRKACVMYLESVSA